MKTREETGRKRLTLSDLKELEQDMLTPAMAADVLGCTAFYLGSKCQEEPEKVPFPFICIGNRTIIPRKGFIRWAEGALNVKYEQPRKRTPWPAEDCEFPEEAEQEFPEEREQEFPDYETPVTVNRGRGRRMTL